MPLDYWAARAFSLLVQNLEQLVTHVMRTKYNAVNTDHSLALVRRDKGPDGRFRRPVLVYNRKASNS